MAPLTYPAWYSDLDRVRTDDALKGVMRLRTWSSPHGIGFFYYPSDAEAQAAVLEVLAVIVQILQEHQQLGDPSGRELHVAAHRFRADLVAWAYPHRSSPPGIPLSSLDTFTRTVCAAVDQCAWWQPFQTTPGAKAKTSQKRTPHDVERLKAERERVVLPLLDDLDWNPTKWAAESGVNPSVTIDYLDGRSTPRKVQMTRIRNTLAKALNQLHTFQLPK